MASSLLHNPLNTVICVITIIVAINASSSLFASASDMISSGPSSSPGLMPLYTHIRGQVMCTGVSSYCAGVANGVFKSWFQFDDKTDAFIAYREDTVMTNSSLVYTREYFFPNEQYEYFLYGSSSTSLLCVHRNNAPTLFPRNFAMNTTYAGTTTLPTYMNLVVDVWQGEWLVFDQWDKYHAFVRRDGSNQIMGWAAGTISYIFEELHDNQVPFPDIKELFTPPTKADACSPMKLLSQD